MVWRSLDTAPSHFTLTPPAQSNLRHLEYFADHERVDRLLFDGVLEPQNGVLRPDLSRPGMGLELKRSDAQQFLVDV